MDIELIDQIKTVLDREEAYMNDEATRRENYTIHYSAGGVKREATVSEVVIALCGGHEVEVVDKTLGGIK